MTVGEVVGEVFSLAGDAYARLFGFYTSGTKFDPERDIPDLTGKTALVTGGNAGVGYHITHELAKKGCKVFMGSRSTSRGNAALKRMKEEGGLGTGSVQVIKLDLTTPTLARAAAHNFFAVCDGRLDILVCSAGVLPGYYQSVYEGGLKISDSMASSHLGHFVLCKQLMPLMEATASSTGDVRIISLSSDTHWLTPLEVNLRTLEGWNYRRDAWIGHRIERYALSKLANILFVKQLDKQLAAPESPEVDQGGNIIPIAVHPGRIYSDGARQLIEQQSFFPAFWFFVLSLLAFSPFQAAFTPLFAATSPKVKKERTKYSGAYLLPFDRIARPSWRARDSQLAEDLWAASEEISEVCLNHHKQTDAYDEDHTKHTRLD